MVRIIDWDDVWAEPLKLSAVPIGNSLFRWGNQSVTFLAPSLDQMFQEEISRLEQVRTPGISRFSNHLRNSRENLFLFDILHEPLDIESLTSKYPDLMPVALTRSPGALKGAATEWKHLSDFHIQVDGQVPDFPLYIEIQEGLGLYGRNALERFLRMVKRRMQSKWKKVLHRFRTALGSSERM
jgi:hypothetical protein